VKYDTDAIRRDNPLSEYLPKRGIELKRDGNEWIGCCPIHSERTASFQIYPGKKGTQEFKCQGCGVEGDVIDFVQQWDGVEFADACAILGGERTGSDRVAASPRISTVDLYAAWVARLPPDDAPPISAGKRTPPLFNPKRPEKPTTTYTPSAVHTYRTVEGKAYAHVLRVDIDGRKLTPCIMWCRNTETGQSGWCHRPMQQSGRRPYGLDRLARNATGQVLITEGEKCADAGERLLPSLVSMSWVGGTQNVEKTSWTCLEGRDVVIWPDNDEPGVAVAERLAELASEAGARSVKVIEPDPAQPKGWDIADAEAEGWTGRQCLEWARPRARLWPFEPEPAPEPLEPVEAAPEPPEPVEQIRTTDTNVVPLPVKKRRPPRDASEGLYAHLILNEDSVPKPKLMANFVAMFEHHEMMQGVLAMNEFAREVMLMKAPPWERERGRWPARKLADNDVTRAMGWLERMGLTPTHNSTGIALMSAAEAHAFDPVKDYLEGLKWDGTHRLLGGDEQSGWLSHYLGVHETKHQIERIFGMRWLIAGVARNLSDSATGEKVDNMLIIEGAQGKMKSTALEIMGTMNGQRFFTDDVGDIGSKDAVMQLQGNVIVEIAELDALNKADAETIKKWVARKVDAIRLPYGKIVIDMPRRCILAGTVNPSGRGYLKDATGARRFWPVMVQGEIDIAGLRRDRDQLWAEAVHLYRAGEPWWLQGEENDHAAQVQGIRYQEDPWAADIDAFLDTRVGEDFTTSQIMGLLQIPTHQRRQEHETRIVAHLKQRGYELHRPRVDGIQKRVYRRVQE